MNRTSPNSSFSITEKVQKGIQWFLIKCIRFYQLAISPYLGQTCRHSPSCSSYMMEAIKEWGALKGTWMGLRRLARCHPWGTFGYDPVPKNDEDNENENK